MRRGQRGGVGVAVVLQTPQAGRAGAQAMQQAVATVPGEWASPWPPSL